MLSFCQSLIFVTRPIEAVEKLTDLITHKSIDNNVLIIIEIIYE